MQTPRRLRDLGVVVGTLPTGPLNAITDVPGVRVGQTTIATDDLNTGVTAIVPDGYADGLPAAVAVGNGYGKLVGSTQVDELGRIETPILLTGTLSVFRVADALVTWLIERDPKATSLNPVVGETNDAFLSDIRRRPITPEHVHAALDSASTDLPAEGCAGAGTGTTALGFKAGIGTSSRTVEQGSVGAIVQSNFSGLLTVLGRPIPAVPVDADGNSCMIVVATDLPLDARQLGRLARRAVFALARVGSDYAQGSGDYAIAFTTNPIAGYQDKDLRAPFQAVTESVEEALLNSLTMARTTKGHRGNTAHAVPHELIRESSHER
ncbi:S58 family peptidase [Kribbella pittospori]|uniref:S58 family peptidase n=1 Tax=Kribbella pittospori TaxID=722689 RepID=A0A4R0KVN7_9ACTN|nr:P1 family peptidase [Kribbella pittospori]TCC60155.1 S58 family peptidase [Kribbella pittospori]